MLGEPQYLQASAVLCGWKNRVIYKSGRTFTSDGKEYHTSFKISSYKPL